MNNYKYTMRLTKEQREFLFERAKKCGLTVKNYILKECGYWDIN